MKTEILPEFKFVYCRCECGSENSSMVYEKSRNGDVFPIVRCVDCGLVYAKYYPDSDSLSSYYAGPYRKIKHKNQEPGDLYNLQAYKGRKLTKALEDILGFKPESILDYGGAAGGVTDTISGVQKKYIFDLDPKFTKFAETKGLLSICEDELNDLNDIDLIVLSHVLEHVPNPTGMLNKLFPIVSDGGVLAIAVPLIDRSPRRYFSTSFNQDVHLAHKFYFSRNSLARIVEKSGYKVIAYSGEWTFFQKNGDYRRLALKKSIYDGVMCGFLAKGYINLSLIRKGLARIKALVS